jgi:putative inorganic carbon (HCO3(-)) transporter
MERAWIGPRGRGSAAARGAPSPAGRSILAAVLAAEALLLVGAATLFGFGGALALAAASVFFLVAYRAPDLAWALVFLVMPFSSERSIVRGVAVMIPTEPMMVVALVALAYRRIQEGTLLPPASPLHRPLAALGLITLLSAAVGVAPAMGVKAWIISALYAAFGYLYFLSGDCTAARRERWQRLAALAGAFWGIYGTVRILGIGVSSQNAYGLARPFFPEHGTYAAYLGLLLPIPLLLALERRGWERALYGAATFAIAMGLTLSFTRAAWLAVLLVVPLSCWIWARRRRAARLMLAPALVAVAVTLFVTALGIGGRLTRHAETVASEENVSNLERLNRWSAALSMARARPLLGVGFGGYEAAYRSYRGRQFSTEESRVWMGAHSEPLKLLSETGAPGFLAALWFLGAAAVVGWRVVRAARSDADRLLALAVMAGLATYAVHGVFNAYLGIDKVSLPFWMAFGVIAGLGRGVPRGGPAPPPR